MKTCKNLYARLYSTKNLYLAFKKARKNKARKHYILEFEKDLANNISILKHELKSFTYEPKPLKKFILRDPKLRVIHISAFRDRIVHHALVNVIGSIFEKIFICDSYASRLGKGTSNAILRFDRFKRKVSKNGKVINNAFDNNHIIGYCLKADIKHYFEEVDHEILLGILNRKIKDEKVIWLIKKVLNNFDTKIKCKGMPLGNFTSQFFANVYLNELDYFMKHELKAKRYIRYVDDFIVLHSQKQQLEIWKSSISEFLNKELKLELHPDKSKIIPMSRGIDFLGFRNFYHYKLLRKRNIRKMFYQIEMCKNNEISYDNLVESFQGWQAYAKHANAFKLRKNIFKVMQNAFSDEVSSLEINRLIKANKVK